MAVEKTPSRETRENKIALDPEFIRRAEDLTGMDVGYRYDGALSVSSGGCGGKELSTAIALQQGSGIGQVSQRYAPAKLKWRHDLVANAGMGVPVRRGLRRKRRNSYRKQQREN